MLSTGSVFLYGDSGVCRVQEIRRERFKNRGEQDYYILKPVYRPNATLHVPADGDIFARRMRPLLTRDEAQALVQDLPGLETDWISDDKARAEHFRQVISDCDRRELLRMVKTVYRRRRELLAMGRRLHSVDEALWHSAEKIVSEEIAFVLEKEPDGVLKELFGQTA